MASISWEDLLAAADAPDVDFEEGKVYDVVVDEAEFKDSSNKDPQFKLIFEVVSGEAKGRKMYHWITAASSSSYSQRRFVEDLRTLLGPDVKLDLSSSDREAVAAPLFGVKARITVKSEKRSDTGEMTMRVAKLLPAASTTPVAPAAPAAEAAPASPPPPPIS